jgi:hypothetical protein
MCRMLTAIPKRLFPCRTGTLRGGWGPAEPLPVSPPRIDFLDDGDATLVKVRVTSPRRGQVITLNTDRPVQNTIITADGEPPATASPSYPDDAGTRPWPYELRFPQPSGGRVRRPTSRCRTPSYLRQRLHRRPGTDNRYTPRPADLARSPAHNSDIVVVGRSLKP